MRVAGSEELGGAEVAEGLMGAGDVVEVFESAKGLAKSADCGGGVGAVIELLPVGAVGTLDVAVELGAPWWQLEEADAGRLKGIRSCTAASARAADAAVASEASRATDQRLTTSTAVNCLRTTPGSGRISTVSISTRSPGWRATYSLGLRVA